MVHCGSRGSVIRLASDYLKVFEKAMRRNGITVKDQQLACAPFRSPEGQEYFSAMNVPRTRPLPIVKSSRIRFEKPSQRYSSVRRGTGDGAGV